MSLLLLLSQGTTTADDRYTAGAGHPWIIYDEIPVKTVKKIVKKVKTYQKIEKKKEISPEAIDAIAEAMVEAWDQKELEQVMELHHITREIAIFSYRETIKQLIKDDELALILILASI